MRKLPIAVGAVGLLTGALAAVLIANLIPARTTAAPQAVASHVVGFPRTPHEAAIDAAQRRGLRVWIESDLVKQWIAGPGRFRAAVDRIGALAARPGVVGIKVADEMGYRDGLDSPQKVRSFLADAAAALHAVAPGKPLLVDIIVPELGCLPNFQPPLRWATICAAQQRGRYPHLALDQVDEYLRTHTIDVLDLSTALQPDRTYTGWGVDRDIAQRTAWAEVLRRGWDQHVRLQARKALAHPGRYQSSDTAALLATFVDIPCASGATAADVWTWRQMYQGEVYRLLDPGLRTNALWDGLARRRADGAVLFTHLSPLSLEVGLEADLAVLATVFTDLFVAAGTG
jgi:hypothetical protein